MNAIIEGILHFCGDEEKVSESSALTKQTAVVKTDGQYTEYIPIEFLNGKCGAELEKKYLDDRVKIHVNIKGREYKKDGEEPRYFLSLQGWKVE